MAHQIPVLTFRHHLEIVQSLVEVGHRVHVLWANPPENQIFGGRWDDQRVSPQIQDWERAIKSLDVLIKKIPNNAEVLNFVGYILVDKSDRIKEGLGYIERAIQLDSQNGFFLDSLGWAYYKLQKIDKAIYYLERAVELEPQEAEITSHLGDAYWQSKRYKEAMVQWKRALTLNGIDSLQEEIKSKLQRSINE